MHKEPALLTATEAIQEIRTGRLSVTEWVESCITQIERYDEQIHAFSVFDPDIVRSYVKPLEERIRKGSFQGNLYGAPVGVKDVFNTQDYSTCMGSPIWKEFTPGNDARVVFSLKEKGGIVMGKTVTAEFGVHYPGSTVNPYNIAHTPGTSSSGSAAAVASGMVPLALGTQTAGSTIRPASYCGVYGFKPSFGLVPRTGVLKTSDTLDHISLFARSLADIVLLFETVRVRGTNHPYAHQCVDQYVQSENKTWRVALVRGPVWDKVHSYAQEALLDFENSLSQSGIQVEECSLPDGFEEVYELHDILYSKSLSYYFREEYDQHKDLMSKSFLEMVERGREISPENYSKALSLQTDLAEKLDAQFEQYDIILGLSAAGESPQGLNPTEPPDCCLVWTLCHVPSMNIPLFTSPRRLPYGLQIVAKKYRDSNLFKFVEILQSQGILPESCELPPLEQSSNNTLQSI